MLHLSTAGSPAEDFSKFQADMGRRRVAGEAPGPRKKVLLPKVLKAEDPSEGLDVCCSKVDKKKQT